MQMNFVDRRNSVCLSHVELRTETDRKMVSLVSDHMHPTRLGSIYFLWLLLLSPVKCQTFCYFPNDCRQLLIVRCECGADKLANSLSQWFICAVRVNCLEFEWHPSVFGLCCAFKESLKWFSIFNINTKKCDVQRWKRLRVWCVLCTDNHMPETLRQCPLQDSDWVPWQRWRIFINRYYYGLAW